MEDQKKKICKDCKLELPESAFTYTHKSKGILQSYCKKCHYERSKIYAIKMKSKRKKRSVTTKVWEKVNKNHYPDPDWVWTQIENNESPAAFHDKLEKKYALKKHGNSGKANRWLNENGKKMNTEQYNKKHNK